MNKLYCLIILCLVPKYESARILAVFPTPSISHQVTFRPLTQELAKRGHELVIVTTDPIFKKGEAPENYTEIDVHDVSYPIWRNEYMPKMPSGRKGDIIKQFEIIYEMMTIVFEKQMNVEEVQQILKKKTKPFDLILAEAYILPVLGFSHIYKVPVILMSSFLPIYTDLRIVGAPDHPLLYPGMGRQKLDNMSLIEKVTELYENYCLDKIITDHEVEFDKSMKKVFGFDVPSLKQLYNNVDMLFVNVFPIWDSNRPVPPSIQYLGGIHVKPLKELPQNLKSYMDSSKHGVIYISFGTNVNPSSLPPERIQTLINVLSRSSYDVIWKWDKDELPGRTKNIKISKWLPQSDLLRHPKIKLFVTQGGLQSTDEAIVAGVPLLGIPMLGDQWFNVAMYERHKIGVKVELENLNEENFRDAIETLTKDDTYKNNMQRFRNLLYDQPQSPLERAVWWTEHVLRHGGAAHLRAPAANLAWSRYYELPLIAAALAALVAIIAITTLALYYCIRLVLKVMIREKLKRN